MLKVFGDGCLRSSACVCWDNLVEDVEIKQRVLGKDAKLADELINLYQLK